MELAGFRYFSGNLIKSMSVSHQGGVTFDLLDRNLKN
jgi:hypothetical protein